MAKTTTPSKDAYVNARVNKKLKEKAEVVLRRVGVTTTGAVTMLLHQIVLHEGLPFDVRMPNAKTKAAIQELETGKGELFTGSTKDFLDNLS